MKPILKQTPQTASIKRTDSTSSSVHSSEADADFLKMEQQFKLESPMSEICGLFKKAVLSPNTRTSIEHCTFGIRKELLQLDDAYHNFNMLNKQFLLNIEYALKSNCLPNQAEFLAQTAVNQNFESAYRERINTITSLLQQIDDFQEQKSKSNKENMVVRKSPRIAQKNIQSSPGISKKENLRVETLKKSLKKQVVFECATPPPNVSEKRNYMNDTMKNCDVQHTPKFTRYNVDTPNSCTGRRKLSRAVQRQYLMLQDTPHKN